MQSKAKEGLALESRMHTDCCSSDPLPLLAVDSTKCLCQDYFNKSLCILLCRGQGFWWPGKNLPGCEWIQGGNIPCKLLCQNHFWPVCKHFQGFSVCG